MPYTSHKAAHNDYLPEGKYRCKVTKCGETTTQSAGIPIVRFVFEIRRDVKQPFGGFRIDKAFFMDDKTGRFPDDKIGKYAANLGVPDGASFELSELVGRYCYMTVREYTDKNTGDKKSCVYFIEEDKEPLKDTVPADQAPTVPAAPATPNMPSTYQTPNTISPQTMTEIKNEDDLPF